MFKWLIIGFLVDLSWETKRLQIYMQLFGFAKIVLKKIRRS